MKELQHALYDILLQLREGMGGKTARKNLGGKGTPGDYLNHMLAWLGRQVGATPLPPREQWQPGRVPTETNIIVLISAAVNTPEFERARGEFARAICTFASKPNFPNCDAIRSGNVGADVWIEFFRKLVEAAVPQQIASVAERHRPPWLVLPERCSRRGIEQPGLLLRADYGVVPFEGRAAELVSLRQWCNQPSNFAINCYTGAGGMGKTRLGLELCDHMQRDGWLSGVVRPDTLPVKDGNLIRPPRLQVPALVVMDYADRERQAVLSLVRWGLQGLCQKLRILLLARSAGEWWQLVDEAAAVDRKLRCALAGEPVPLAPLAITPEERESCFRRAQAAFAGILNRKAPRNTVPKLQASYFSMALWIHMAALLAVEGQSVQGEYAILDEVLRRERRYWRRLAESFEISASLVRLLGRPVAVFTATDGVASRREAVELLRGIPGFRDQPEAVLESVATLLHECFPGERWIEPLQPDRLGDRLVELETDRNPNLFAEFVPEAWRRRPH
jgi:hypothetical protein